MPVADLGHPHVSALDALAAGEIEREVFNLGCGAGYTIKEVIDTAEQVTGRPIAVQWGARRPGDPAVLVASAEKIRRVLGWTPAQGSLDDIVQSAWNREVAV